MSEISPAYTLAEHIHTSFFGDQLLSDAEKRSSKVVARTGSRSSTTVERVQVTGLHEGRLAFQSLGRNKKGMYHFSTTYLDNGGAHVPMLISPKAPLEALEALAGSMFVRKLVEIG